MEIKSKKIGKLLLIPDRNPLDREQVVFQVYLDHVPVVRFNVDDIKERKLAAVALVERGLCCQKDAGKICGFHRNTVFKLLRIKNLLGIDALLQDDRGLKTPFKYVGKIRSKVKKLLRKHPDWTDQDIADQATNDLGVDISRSSVARIRTEKQCKSIEIPTKNELLDLAKEAESIERDVKAQRQLWLNFDTEPELKEVAEASKKEPSPEVSSERQQRLMEQLNEGKYCYFAGGLMHHLFLQEIGFEKIMSSFPLKPGSTYQYTDIMGTIFHSITQGIGSIERLKLFNASDLGILIGQNRIPDKTVLRDHLDQMAKQYYAGKLIDEFAQHLLEQDRIDREVFFIDGHFLPYYGLKVIAKGYHTVRRMAMKGNELYMITDLQGRPLFFITESNEIDFRPIISRSAAMLEELGVKRPILVFDRGGYGIHFFQELNINADFVTWAKYLDKKRLEIIPESSFTVGVWVNGSRYMVAEQTRVVRESPQTAKKEGREKPTSIELRMIVLKDVKTGKRMGIYTNNMSKPLYDIAYYMLNRWGKSENVYKEFMDLFNLNYHPGYDIKELEKQPMIDNPDITLMKNAIKILRQEVKELEMEILVIKAKLEKRQDKRLIKKLAILEEDLVEKNEDICKFHEKISTLPSKVSIVEILKGKVMSHSDLEKKRLYDLMQIMAYHSREMLVDLFKECYDDHRDVKKILDMITRRPGVVKLVGQTLIVILEWIENKKYREAAERLCYKLNQKGIRMVGGLNIKLSFHVARIQ